MASVIDVSMPSERFQIELDNPELDEMKRIIDEVDKEVDGEVAADEEKESLASEAEEDPGNGLEEGEAGGMAKSTAAVMDYLRKKGMLSKDRTIAYAGRANDTKYHKELERVGGSMDDELTLDYRDKTGRLMTQKQAFRYMCWTFHNKKPSKVKLAKMMAKYNAIQKVRNTLYSRSGLIPRS